MQILNGRELSIQRKAFRRAVANGQASWADRLPATHRRPFGQGLGERHPIHRLPGGISVEDHEWWSLESQRAEEREMERRAGEFLAYDRMAMGLPGE